MSFTSRLKQAMAEQEISQSELSMITGIGKSSISQYLAGRNIPREQVKEKLAGALNCTAEFFDSETPDEEEYSTTELRNISIATAAKMLGKSQQFVRVSLQMGTAPFGFAAKSKSTWSYHISRKKLVEYIGSDLIAD